MLGVLKAVERFDPDRGIPFAAFAVPTVVGELRRHFRDRGWMVRVPRRLQDLHLRIGPVVAELSQQLGRSPTVARDRRRGQASATKTCSKRSTPGTATGPRRSTSPVEPGEGRRDRARARSTTARPCSGCCATYPKRAQRVMYMRYFEDMTQAEIAEAIGVSQMHVSRHPDPQPRNA